MACRRAGRSPTFSVMNVSVISRGGVEEQFHTFLPDSADPVHSLVSQLEAVLEQVPAEVLEIRVFSASETFPELRSALGALPGAEDWPISLLDGASTPEGGVAGLQLHLLEGAPVSTLRLGQEVAGRAFEDEDARFVVLGGLGPSDIESPQAHQTTETLLRMEEALKSQEMDLRELVRTWFFLDDILGWYGNFNQARTRIFEDRGVFRGYVPASTGIGGRNHRASAVMASALAMKPKGATVGVEEVPSPLQCSAGSYGSAFSRAAEVRGTGYKRVFVSGTASIDPEGNTVHQGDVEAQIGLTFQVVEAILQSRGVGFQDVIRANAYFKDVADAPLLAPSLEEHGLPQSRLVISQNAVCRDDLLFEMEVEAAQGTP